MNYEDDLWTTFVGQPRTIFRKRTIGSTFSAFTMSSITRGWENSWIRKFRTVSSFRRLSSTNGRKPLGIPKDLAADRQRCVLIYTLNHTTRAWLYVYDHRFTKMHAHIHMSNCNKAYYPSIAAILICWRRHWSHVNLLACFILPVLFHMGLRPPVIYWTDLQLDWLHSCHFVRL